MLEGSSKRGAFGSKKADESREDSGAKAAAPEDNDTTTKSIVLASKERDLANVAQFSGQGFRSPSEHCFSDSDTDDDDDDAEDGDAYEGQKDKVEPSPATTTGTSSEEEEEEESEKQQSLTVSPETASIAPHSDGVLRKKPESTQPASVLDDKGGANEGREAGGGEKEGGGEDGGRGGEGSGGKNGVGEEKKGGKGGGGVDEGSKMEEKGEGEGREGGGREKKGGGGEVKEGKEVKGEEEGGEEGKGREGGGGKEDAGKEKEDDDCPTRLAMMHLYGAPPQSDDGDGGCGGTGHDGAGGSEGGVSFDGMTFQDVDEPPTGEAGKAFKAVLEPVEPEEVGGAGSLLDYVQRTQPSVAVSSSSSSTAAAAATAAPHEETKGKGGRRAFSAHTALEVMTKYRCTKDHKQMPLGGGTGQAPLNTCHGVASTDSNGKTIVSPVFPNGLYFFREDMATPRVDEPFLSPKSCPAGINHPCAQHLPPLTLDAPRDERTQDSHPGLFPPPSGSHARGAMSELEPNSAYHDTRGRAGVACFLGDGVKGGGGGGFGGGYGGGCGGDYAGVTAAAATGSRRLNLPPPPRLPGSESNVGGVNLNGNTFIGRQEAGYFGGGATSTTAAGAAGAGGRGGGYSALSALADPSGLDRKIAANEATKVPPASATAAATVASRSNNSSSILISSGAINERRPGAANVAVGGLLGLDRKIAAEVQEPIHPRRVVDTTARVGRGYDATIARVDEPPAPPPLDLDNPNGGATTVGGVGAGAGVAPNGQGHVIAIGLPSRATTGRMFDLTSRHGNDQLDGGVGGEGEKGSVWGDCSGRNGGPGGGVGVDVGVGGGGGGTGACYADGGCEVAATGEGAASSVVQRGSANRWATSYGGGGGGGGGVVGGFGGGGGGGFGFGGGGGGGGGFSVGGGVGGGGGGGDAYFDDGAYEVVATGRYPSSFTQRGYANRRATAYTGGDRGGDGGGGIARYSGGGGGGFGVGGGSDGGDAYFDDRAYEVEAVGRHPSSFTQRGYANGKATAYTGGAGAGGGIARDSGGDGGGFGIGGGIGGGSGGGGGGGGGGFDGFVGGGGGGGGRCDGFVGGGGRGGVEEMKESDTSCLTGPKQRSPKFVRGDSEQEAWGRRAGEGKAKAGGRRTASLRPQVSDALDIPPLDLNASACGYAVPLEAAALVVNASMGAMAAGQPPPSNVNASDHLDLPSGRGSDFLPRSDMGLRQQPSTLRSGTAANSTASGGGDSVNWTAALDLGFLSSPEDQQQHHHHQQQQQHQQQNEENAGEATAASSPGNTSTAGGAGGGGDGGGSSGASMGRPINVGGAAAESARDSGESDHVDCVDADENDDIGDAGDVGEGNGDDGDGDVSEDNGDGDSDDGLEWGESLNLLFSDVHEADASASVGAVENDDGRHLASAEPLLARFEYAHESGASAGMGMGGDVVMVAGGGGGGGSGGARVASGIRIPVRDEVDWGASLNALFTAAEEEEQEKEVDEEEEKEEEEEVVEKEGEENWMEELEEVEEMEEGDEGAADPVGTPWFNHIRSTIARNTVPSCAQGLLRWATGTMAGASVAAAGAAASSGDNTPANQDQLAFATKEPEWFKGPKWPEGPHGFGGGWRSCPEVTPYWENGGGVEGGGLRQTRWTSRCV